MTFVYILTGKTESGDDIGPYVYSSIPTQKDIDNLLREEWNEDFLAETITRTMVTEVKVQLTQADKELFEDRSYAAPSGGR